MYRVCSAVKLLSFPSIQNLPHPLSPPNAVYMVLIVENQGLLLTRIRGNFYVHQSVLCIMLGQGKGERERDGKKEQTEMEHSCAAQTLPVLYKLAL